MGSARRHDGRLVARPGADIQRVVTVAELEGLHDDRHHQRLRDRLVVADRQRPVDVRVRLIRRLDECFPRNGRHGCQDPWIADATLAESFEHRVAATFWSH